jgi:hypothetical protein
MLKVIGGQRHGLYEFYKKCWNQPLNHNFRNHRHSIAAQNWKKNSPLWATLTDSQDHDRSFCWYVFRCCKRLVMLCMSHRPFTVLGHFFGGPKTFTFIILHSAPKWIPTDRLNIFLFPSKHALKGREILYKGKDQLTHKTWKN